MALWHDDTDCGNSAGVHVGMNQGMDQASIDDDRDDDALDDNDDENENGGYNYELVSCMYGGALVMLPRTEASPTDIRDRR